MWCATPAGPFVVVVLYMFVVVVVPVDALMMVVAMV
jgi:hypothetical protein